MKKGLTSIVISSYNHGGFLREAIDSALNQTYSATEVIVVDDGSTDDSRQIIADFGSRIVPLLKENTGQASALNVGFGLSRGDVIVFLDSDDSLLPTAVQRAVDLFREPDVVKVHWPLWEFDVHGAKTGRVMPLHQLPEGDLRESRIRDGVYYYDWPPTSGNAWARPLLERILPLPEQEYRTCPDIYLSVLAPVFGVVKTIREPQGCYRVHARNRWDDISLADQVRMLDRSYIELREHLDRLGINANVAAWKSHGWLHQVYAAVQEIEAIIPAGATFILVDEDEIRSEIAISRHTIPLTEREGDYWGPPEDDMFAIREIERARQTGASFLALAWPAFWWLDYYSDLHRYLRSEFRCVLENNRLIIFDLRTARYGCARKRSEEAVKKNQGDFH
jgi:glycosyltransferase involved in cell wall biosynthesis